MFKIRNLFKKRENKKSSKDFKSVGELAWGSINLENEPKMIINKIEAGPPKVRII